VRLHPLPNGREFLHKLDGFILLPKKNHENEKENMVKIHIPLNPYYKNMVDHPGEVISPRLAGESNVSIVRMGLDALLVQERNRLQMEEQNEQGERRNPGE